MKALDLPLIFSALAAFSEVANAADCLQDQPRNVGDPSGQEISDALTNQDQVHSICTSGFPPGSDTISTFNHGEMIYNITRDDPSQPLDLCEDGFNDIIQQCILNDNFWGGVWNLNGQTYKVYNQAFPSNPLLPNDPGAPSSSSASPISSIIGSGTLTGNTGSTTNGPITTAQSGSTGIDASVTQASGTTGAATTAFSQPLVTEPRSSNSPTSIAGETVIITTVSGQTETVTFVPTTIASFAGLTSQTTITESSNGGFFPFVIGPGGIAWAIFGIPPPIPIGPPPTPPVIPGDGSGNDPTGTAPSVTSAPASSTQPASSSAASSSAVSSSSAFSFRIRDISVQEGCPPKASSTAGPLTSSHPAATSHAAPTTQPITTTIPAPAPVTTTSRSSYSPTTFIEPTSTGVNCGTGSSSGARLGDCLALLGRVPSDTQVCTNDADACLNSGTTSNGQENLSSYCELSQNSGCALVAANKLASFGFPGFSCFTGAQLDQFIRVAANQCAGDDSTAIAQGPNGFDTFCLVSQDDPGVCAA